MLKRLCRSWLRGALLAVLLVCVLSTLGFAAVNSGMTVSSLDRLLELMAENGGTMPALLPEQAGGQAAPWKLNVTPETVFETRYFSVRPDAAGAYTQTALEHIAGVTQQQAAQLAAQAQASGRRFGWSGDYRWYHASDGADGLLLFLDASGERHAMRRALLASSAATLVEMAAVLALLQLFSRRATAAVADSLRKQKQFVTDASHQLKTPLTVISTSADVLAGELPENNVWLDNIQGQCAQLGRLVNDLVTLSRLDEETPQTERMVLSLSDAVWDALGAFLPVGQARGLRFEQEIDENVCCIGDAALIGRLVSVLLDNAVKYADAGGTVTVRLHRRGRRCVLEVENPCAGLASEETGRLFDRFYRGSGAPAGGSGVGLSIVRAAAEAHGGTARADCPAPGVLRVTVSI